MLIRPGCWCEWGFTASSRSSSSSKQQQRRCFGSKYAAAERDKDERRASLGVVGRRRHHGVCRGRRSVGQQHDDLLRSALPADTPGRQVGPDSIGSFCRRRFVVDLSTQIRASCTEFTRSRPGPDVAELLRVGFRTSVDKLYTTNPQKIEPVEFEL